MTTLEVLFIDMAHMHNCLCSRNLSLFLFPTLLTPPPSVISLFTCKIDFLLYDHSIRFPRPVIEQHPFQVIESGWGEFEILIDLYFKDSSIRPIHINHLLRLYPVGSDGMVPSVEPVVSEFYDELVFRSPTEPLHKSLLKEPKIMPPPEWNSLLPVYSDAEDCRALMAAQNFVSSQLSQLKERLAKVEELEKARE